ncbi:MAG TPA: FHA domain-containing protein [Labilithrix sp.]
MHAMKSEARRQRTFLCRDELYAAFESRARELECSVDWLIGEAMKRMLRAEKAPRSSLPPPPGSQTPRIPPPPRRLSVAPSAPAGPPPAPPPPPPPSFAPPATTIALRARDDTRVVVDRDRFVIGRSGRDAHFIVRDPSVSRQHAMVERGAGGWFIVDMASANGVWLNGAAVTRALLRPGDVIVIGPIALTVERA